MHLEAPDESIWIGVLRLELTINGSRSLKDKRKQVSRFRERFRKRYNMSVAEVGHLQNKHHSVLAACMISNDQKHLRSVLDSRANEAMTLLDARIDSHQILVFPSSNPPWTPHD